MFGDVCVCGVILWYISHNSSYWFPAGFILLCQSQGFSLLFGVWEEFWQNFSSLAEIAVGNSQDFLRLFYKSLQQTLLDDSYVSKSSQIISATLKVYFLQTDYVKRGLEINSRCVLQHITAVSVSQVSESQPEHGSATSGCLT